MAGNALEAVNHRGFAQQRPSKKFPLKGADFSSISVGGSLNSRAQGKMDNIIEAKELQIERKHFYVELRENDRGKFLRITEEAHGRRNSIIVPSTGIDDFTAIIAEVLTNGETAPA
jgi:PurA ssDNA and RNA-binding protein